MKKAQTISQPFIYIAAIIIAGLVLILGAKVIKYITEEKPIIIETVFLDKIKEDLKSVSYGEIRTLNYPLEGHTCACFVESNAAVPDPPHGLIKISHYETPTYNLFLGKKFKPESFVPVAQLGEIEVEGGFTCYAIRGGILEFTVEGLGRYPRILKPESSDTESPKCEQAGP